jgi:hypothetical protein
MFGLTTWNISEWKARSFSPDLISAETHRSAERMIEEQYGLPTREVWSIGVLDVTLRQINYLAEVDRFAEPAHATRLLDELLTVVRHLEKMARSGFRFPPGQEPTPDSPPFRVYHNELSNTNNIVLVHSDTAKFLFTTLINPNYIVTTDGGLYEEGRQWFDNLIEHGNALHSRGGKYASWYFGYLRRRIEQYRRRLSGGWLDF